MTTGSVATAGDLETKADDNYRQGSEAYREGDFVAAALAFEAAYRLLPRGAAAYSAALAWDAAGESARAADALVLALEQETFAERSDAEARLLRLRRSLGRLRIIGSPKTRVSVAHRQRAALPLETHLAPGESAVIVEEPGTPERVLRVRLEAGGSEVLELSPQRAALPAPEPSKPSPMDPSPDDDVTALSIGGWLGLGLGLALAGAAVGTGIAALGAESDYAEGLFVDVAARDRAATLETTTNVLWPAAGIFAVTGAVLLIVDFAAEPDVVEVTQSGFRLRF